MLKVCTSSPNFFEVIINTSVIETNSSDDTKDMWKLSNLVKFGV